MEKELETLGKILDLIRFLKKREKSLKEDLEQATRMGVSWYTKNTVKYLTDNYRAQERLKNRYNRILTQLEGF